MLTDHEREQIMNNTDSQARGTDQELPRVGDAGQQSGRKVISVRHRHIADWLRERIESEELLPGARVPPARELAATFGVGVSTARRALDALTYEGMIDDRHSGVRIRRFRPFRRVMSRDHRQRDPSVWRTHDLSGLTETRHVRVTDEPVPDSVARVLRVPTASVVSVRRSMTMVGGQPVQLTTTYRALDVITTTPQDLLRVREELRLRMPSTAERERLDLPPGVPVVEITKTVYLKGQPVELSTLIIDGNCCILEYDYFVRGCDYVPV
jgi:GntR family transcriptional regulator